MDAATIVAHLRALSGITRKELAELASLAPSTISRIEQGALDPTWTTLSRILEATGYRINGDTIVSVGDATAITAARPLLELAFAEGMAAAARTAFTRPFAASDPAPQATDQWVERWARAGWLSKKADADDLVALAVSAGNAAKIARRNVDRRTVRVNGGWRALARRLDQAGVDYAVSGLVATRADRATAVAASPVVYVEKPSRVLIDLGLEEASPGLGVLLIAPAGDELARAEVDDGVRFVSQAQGVLDAFAGPGREPDKAENTLRRLLAASA